MANTLGFYNPAFYANEALIQLEEAMGMAGRVHMGFDAERRSFNKGDTINIKRPSTFAAQSAPSAAQDVLTESVAITLDQWFEVKFKISDKEWAYSGDRIITDHIRPAARALASKIDTDLALLAQTGTGWYVDGDGGTDGNAAMVPAGIIAAHRVLFDNKAPMDGPERMHLMIDGLSQESLLGQARFVEQQGAGQEGVNVQRTGSLGEKYGFEIFANQNTQSHTTGTADDTALLAMGAATKGDVTVTLDAADAGVAGTIAAGDSFVFAGHTQRYVCTATNTASANVFTNVAIFPALQANVADDEVCTLYLNGSAGSTHKLNLAFHRNSMALAMAQLPGGPQLNELGANVASVQHPNSGVALRSRLYYVGNSSEVHVALDVLYGVKALDANLMCRIHT